MAARYQLSKRLQQLSGQRELKGAVQLLLLTFIFALLSQATAQGSNSTIGQQLAELSARSSDSGARPAVPTATLPGGPPATTPQTGPSSSSITPRSTNLTSGPDTTTTKTSNEVRDIQQDEVVSAQGPGPQEPVGTASIGEWCFAKHWTAE
jgi:hypothetical protein